MYYVRSEKLVNTENVGSRVTRVRLEDEISMTSILEDSVCLSCEG